MRICKNCGYEVDDISQFCENCGKYVSKQEELNTSEQKKHINVKGVIHGIITIIIIIVFIAFCGHSSNPLSKAQNSAVKIGNQFLHHKITAKEAKKQLKSIEIPYPQRGGLFLSGDIYDLCELLDEYIVDYDAVEEQIGQIKSFDYVDINKKMEMNNIASEGNIVEENKKIDTFDVDKKSVISLFEETGKYIGAEKHDFNNNEDNTYGTIQINSEKSESISDDECIHTQVRSFEDKVIDVSLTYDISGNEMYYEKLYELSKKVLAILKPNIDETFFDNFDISSNYGYINEFEDLLYTISCEEVGETVARINIQMLHK